MEGVSPTSSFLDYPLVTGVGWGASSQSGSVESYLGVCGQECEMGLREKGGLHRASQGDIPLSGLDRFPL